MKTRIAVLAAVLVAALQGCRGTETSVEIASICAYNESCTFSSTCDATLLNKPWVDAGVAAEFVVFAEFRNGAVNTADPETGRFNTADAYVDHYEVEIVGAAAPLQVIDVGPYLVPAGGSAVLPIWLIVGGSGADTAVAAAASGSPGTPLTARITASGEYADGTSFEVERDIPFYSCSDCWDATCTSACPGLGQIGVCTTAPAP
jgi:hypothetical protein